MKRKSKLICLCLSVALCTFTFAPGCSFFRTAGGGYRFMEWLQSGKGESAGVFRGRMRLLPKPADAESYYVLGCSYQRAGRHVEAIEELEKAVALKPDFVEAENRLGISYDRLDQFEKAEKAYLAALGINPWMAYTHNNLGFSYLLQGKWEAAIDAFRRAVELNGDRVSARLYNNLGLAYAMAGAYGKAMEVFEGAFGKAEARYRMARVYSYLGMTWEAGRYYASAAELDPTSSIYRKAMEESGDDLEFATFVAQIRKVVGHASPAAPDGGNAERANAVAEAGIEISNGNGGVAHGAECEPLPKRTGFHRGAAHERRQFHLPPDNNQLQGAV